MSATPPRPLLPHRNSLHPRLAWRDRNPHPPPHRTLAHDFTQNPSRPPLGAEGTPRAATGSGTLPRVCCVNSSRNWKSPRGGWIGKSEIYNFKAQLQVGVSVRNKSESEREGENKSTKEIERMTRWFVLPRFGSKEPSPRWGGHKDRVSSNPFPLSNGHLDRVSFLLNQMGHLDPHKDHYKLSVSCFDYKCLRIRMGKKKARLQKPSDKSDK
jgi:hypothetical protein